MIHKMTLRSNPRLILFGLLVPGVPLLGVFLLVFLGGIWGIVALLGCSFFTYQFTTFMLPHVRIRIETTEDGITCIRPGNYNIAFQWPEVSHAGLVRQESQKPSIFLYSEEHDRFVTISEEFSNFEQLLATVKEHTPFQEIQLAKTDSIQEWLRQQLHIDGEEANDT